LWNFAAAEPMNRIAGSRLVRIGRNIVVGVAALGLALTWSRRDPERIASTGAESILAPADGRVLLVDLVEAPRWLSGPVWRIVIFLALWDVHVQRAPIGGRLAFQERQPGGFAPAFTTSAVGNYGEWLGFTGDQGPALLLRTTGLFARRITTRVSIDQPVARGQRIGSIFLGSRAELYLPSNATPQVSPGAVVRAGESIVARWPATP
jgi:phosphatidylserine decarboxylase